jgi:hypothetical protein
MVATVVRQVVGRYDNIDPFVIEALSLCRMISDKRKLS